MTQTIQGRHKGFTLGSQHAEMLLLGKRTHISWYSMHVVALTFYNALEYFIVFPNVYCFDRNRIICRVDSRARYHEADLKPNPPERETCFYIEGMPYWFDGSSQLWYNIGGEWLPEVLHNDISQARMELARSAENSKISFSQLNETLTPVSDRMDPTGGMQTSVSSSAGNYGAAMGYNINDEDSYPNQPLSPQPDQGEIDSWFEEFKNKRNNLFKTRDRLSDIRCPVESCRKTQRRPQALRVSLLLLTLLSQTHLTDVQLIGSFVLSFWGQT